MLHNVFEVHPTSQSRNTWATTSLPRKCRTEKNPWTRIKTSGLSVGLPDGQMGNSEVGHLNLGAGRIVNQDIVRINSSIEKNFGKKIGFCICFDKYFFKNIIALLLGKITARFSILLGNFLINFLAISSKKKVIV